MSDAGLVPGACEPVMRRRAQVVLFWGEDNPESPERKIGVGEETSWVDLFEERGRRHGFGMVSGACDKSLLAFLSLSRSAVCNPLRRSWGRWGAQSPQGSPRGARGCAKNGAERCRAIWNERVACHEFLVSDSMLAGVRRLFRGPRSGLMRHQAPRGARMSRVMIYRLGR